MDTELFGGAGIAQGLAGAIGACGVAGSHRGDC